MICCNLYNAQFLVVEQQQGVVVAVLFQLEARLPSWSFLICRVFFIVFLFFVFFCEVGRCEFWENCPLLEILLLLSSSFKISFLSSFCKQYGEVPV